MNINIKEVYDKVKDYVAKYGEGLFRSVQASAERPYIFIYMNGNNHLDYEFKDNKWIIHLDLNYGHRKVIGEIIGYKGVSYKQDLWKKIEKPIRDHIDKINNIFKETLKSQSIKFITSKVKDKISYSKKLKLYRSDNSKEFSVTSVRMSLGKYPTNQWEHNPAQIMTYFPGVFSTPEKEYAEKYPQDKLYSFEVSGNFLELPKEYNKIKNMTLLEALNWAKENYIGVIGKKAADTNFGKFDEVVIFNKNSIKNVKEIGVKKSFIDKVKHKISKVKKIDTKDILIGRSAIYDTMTDIEEGRPSRSTGPLKVYHIIEGEHKGRYLLADGYHRLFVLLLNHKTKIDVDIIGYGDGRNTDIAIPYKNFSIDPSLKFMGLEDLADEEILEDLKEKLNK